MRILQVLNRVSFILAYLWCVLFCSRWELYLVFVRFEALMVNLSYFFIWVSLNFHYYFHLLKFIRLMGKLCEIFLNSEVNKLEKQLNCLREDLRCIWNCCCHDRSDHELILNLQKCFTFWKESVQDLWFEFFQFFLWFTSQDPCGFSFLIWIWQTYTFWMACSYTDIGCCCKVCQKWKTLAGEDGLWLNLFKERWGEDQATFYAPVDSKSWKDVYEVQDRCDRVGL